MNTNECKNDAHSHDAQDHLIDAAAMGRPSARQVRFSKAAMLEGSTSLIDPRLWPLHGAAMSFVLLVLAAAGGIGKPAQPSAQAEAVAVACSPEERCIVVDPIDGSAVEFEAPRQIAQPGRRIPMMAPGDQFLIAPPAAITQTSDARPLIDYTMPANLR